MTLEAIYFISQVIAAIALVASLLFVGVQIRMARRAMRQQLEIERDAATRQLLVHAREWHRHLVADRETFDAIVACHEDYASRDSYTRSIFAAWMWSLTNLCEQYMYQYQSGMIPKDTYAGTLRGMAMMTRTVGGEQWFVELEPIVAPPLLAEIERYRSGAEGPVPDLYQAFPNYRPASWKDTDAESKDRSVEESAPA